MEESFNKSCVESSAFSMAAGSARSEESGWTTYFEDFMASQEQKQEPGVFSCSSAVSGSSSMISDAASCAVAWKPPSATIAVQPEERRKQLQLRRRNNRKWLLDDDDDSLQDTACSPVNSPKVTELSCLTMDPNKKDGHWDTAQEGDVGYRNTEQDGGFGFVERSTNECAELRNRGLCLVPLSMLVEYLE